MRLRPRISALVLSVLYLASVVQAKNTCFLNPLGPGKDDTAQVLAAIDKCGTNGHTTFAPGNYNITRKMTWDLHSATIDLHGVLNFPPNIDFWLQAENTFRVIFIQSQASWFVVTGEDFVLDAHGTGGIEGNGQPWWEFFTLPSHPRLDGNGRPVSLTLFQVNRGIVKDFTIHSPPFWCNAVANSRDVLYQGMKCNSTNTNPAFAGRNIVPNTDGIDTYRSENIAMIDWDITCGDDCLAIKGNSTNILAKNIMCRGGNGVAFGSLGQYIQFNDFVEHVLMENITTQRLDPAVQPRMDTGVYFKSWTGSVRGTPPTGGGGGGGRVSNVTIRGVFNDRTLAPVRIRQNFGGGSTPSKYLFEDVTFIDVTGTSQNTTLVDFECSPAAPCSNLKFKDFAVRPAGGQTPSFVCQNVQNVQGLPAGACPSTV